MKRLTTKEFIERAILIHGNKYDYSLVVYVNQYQKIKIICPIHGKFKQQPTSHLSGNGCSFCGHRQPINIEEFIKRANLKHQNQFIYDKVKFSKTTDKIKIICPKHGEFEQFVFNHLRGAGCLKCYREKNRSNLEIFIKHAFRVHGDKYNYSLSQYTNSSAKIRIICPQHGEFTQIVNYHLSGNGCPKCGGTYKSNTKEFINKAKKIHGRMYDYTLVDYKNSQTKVKIICLIHGKFLQKPSLHLLGAGCPACSKTGFNSSKPGILYYIKDTTNALYKIGITNLTLKKRFGSKIKKIKVIKTWKFKIGLDAYELEQFLHQELKQFQILNENFSDVGGKTEFFTHDVLNLDKGEI